MHKVILIFLGSGVGGVLRFWLGGAVQAWWAKDGAVFPLGTLVVNITGCFAIGFLATLFEGVLSPRQAEQARAAVLIGVLGGYTTFSAFGRETLVLVQRGEYLQAGTYIVLSVAVGLAAVWAGAALAGRCWGPAAS